MIYLTLINAGSNDYKTRYVGENNTGRSHFLLFSDFLNK